VPSYCARMPFKQWDDTRRVLAHALENLVDGEFLILGEPVPLPATQRELMRRSKPAPTRFVQVLRIDEVLTAECVGATSLGGSWEMDPPTIDRLRSMGWLTPTECQAAYGNTTPNFEQYVERVGLRALADILIASLDLLGALPSHLELETSGGSAIRAMG
jgi:type III secretion system-like peptide-binding chaperone